MKPASLQRDPEAGFTIVALLIALVIIGILINPSTSPFRSKYYNYKAETNLKELYNACGMFWAFNVTGTTSAQHNAAVSADLFASKVTGKVHDPGICDPDTVSRPPYHFIKAPGVVITVEDGSMGNFKATARHPQGDVVFTIDAHGRVNS